MISPALRKIAITTIVSCGALLGVVAPALALETRTAPRWGLQTRVAPASLHIKQEGLITVSATNIGDAPINGGIAKSTVTLTDTLPTGVKPLSAVVNSNHSPLKAARNGASKCQISGAQIECTIPAIFALKPYELLVMEIRVEAEGVLPAPAENHAAVEGGEAETVALETSIKTSEANPSFGVEALEFSPEGEPASEQAAGVAQAGAHPFQLTTTFDFNQGFEPYVTDQGVRLPSAPALPKNLGFRLPPGLIGNVNAVKQCSDASFGAQGQEFANACPNDTAIGVATVEIANPTASGEFHAYFVVPVFNLIPAPGEPARFGFSITHVPVVLDTAVRTGEDYGVNVSVHYASQSVQVLGSKVSFWGIPSDKRHDASRGWACLGLGKVGEVEACEAPHEPEAPEPFLMLPTSCQERLNTAVSGEAWNGDILRGPEERAGLGQPLPEIPNVSPTLISGCDSLPFEPSVEVKPSTHEASTPTGMDVSVKVPQASTMELSYENKSEAAVSSTVLELPEGIQTSAGAANGLTTCAAAGVGFNGFEVGLGEGAQLENNHFDATTASCPNSAKIGTVSIKTPVLERELIGGVYLAQQNTNPFASPLVLYIIAEDKAPDEVNTSKVLVKLAGEVGINPTTGQLISDFKNTPQSPFEELKLHLWDGGRASQASPAHCGTYSPKATFTNSSNELKPEPKDEFSITSGPGGTPCPGATLPFQPTQQAESTNPQAGAFSPFRLVIERPDGNAALKSIVTQLPPGLAALIGSVTPCPEPQAAQGTCGPESLIGHSLASSGLGSSPYKFPGEVFLTGPYNGAPFGLSAVTEATAGPFHLGKVVVRSSISVDEFTAAATITTAAAQFFPLSGETQQFAGLPELLKGAPAQIKRLEVNVDRPNFEFNPTSCTPSAITGQLTGYEGVAPVNVSTPFQLANCGSLPFAPKLTASVQGHASKANGTTFIVSVQSPGVGEANIHKVDLTLPEALPSRLTTIQKACLEAVFNANPAACDEGSVIGEGIVHTPVFKNPLRGPAYLVSHGGAAFPDVEFVLQGENITLVLDGKTDIKKGITYSRFETAPDAPFTTFESIFPAGPHSALTANVPASEEFNLCKHALTMPTEITAQNGAFIPQTTKIELLGCGGVAGFTTAAVKIRRHSVKGSTLTLVVAVPGSGHLTVKGPGLHTLKKSVSKAGNYTLKIKLGPKGKAAVAHKHLLKVRVRLSFAPTHGKASAAAVTAKFH